MGALGIAGIFVMPIWRRITSSSRPMAAFAETGEYKMVILGKGKAAAQCCHAVLETYKQALWKYPKLLESWEEVGQPKITLKVDTEEELVQLVANAKKAGLAARSIRDAGRTQLAAGTQTVAAIGPGPSKMVDLLTGHLKLY